jgi:hypothetical protein
MLVRELTQLGADNLASCGENLAGLLCIRGDSYVAGPVIVPPRPGGRPGAWHRESRSRGARDTLFAASWPVSASRADPPPSPGKGALEAVEDRERRQVLRGTRQAWQDGYERRESKLKALA